MKHALPNVAVAAVLVLTAAMWPAAPAGAARCTWNGTPTIYPPVITPLRAYREPYYAPGRLAFDARGNVYVTDPGAGRVFVQDPHGRLLSEKTGLDFPLAVAVSGAGDIYVGEQQTGSVFVFDPQWGLRYRLGQGGGEFLIPTDIAIDASDGSVFVTDGQANEVRVYSAGGGFLFSFGGPGSGEGQFNFPSAVHVSESGEVYVGDQNNDRVQVFDRTGQFLRCFGSSGSFFFSRRFGRIAGLTTDKVGRVYVADAFQGHVKVFDEVSVLIDTIGRFGEGPGQFRTPLGLGIDRYNRLFVASQNTGRVELFGLDDYSDPVPVIYAEASVLPPQLKRDSKRRMAKVVIELAEVDVGMVDPATIAANGVPAIAGTEIIGDDDADGIADISVKMDFDALVATLPDGRSLVAVNGALVDGATFEGTAAVRVFVGGNPSASSQGKPTRRGAAVR